ncbi:hypothetical protein IW262DRAFT_334204 [Armillaria fumosa]|nr:hypothetical protein IW262DRAFT_334204 [Armillaria fumosa]
MRALCISRAIFPTAEAISSTTGAERWYQISASLASRTSRTRFSWDDMVDDLRTLPIFISAVVNHCTVVISRSVTSLTDPNDTHALPCAPANHHRKERAPKKARIVRCASSPAEIQTWNATRITPARL